MLLAQRWILARLRRRRFSGLDELNRAIQPLLAELNRRPFKRLPGSRQSAFETLAQRLDTTEGALKVAAHRLKQRFRAIVAAEARETLPDDCAPGDELRELLGALQRGRPGGIPGDSP